MLLFVKSRVECGQYKSSFKLYWDELDVVSSINVEVVNGLFIVFLFLEQRFDYDFI